MKFWKFWTIIVLIVFALIIGQYYFGLFNFIMLYDQTYLTFVNFSICGIAHLMLAKMHVKKIYSADDHQMIRYLGESTVTIGLIGTLVGFMIVLWGVFGPGVVLDPTDSVVMTKALTDMAAGMAAALITSLSGIITSTIIGLQLVVLEE